MVRTVLLCFFLFFWCGCMYPHGELESVDKILVKIGEDNVYLSEFDFLYDNVAKFSDCSRDDYFHYFLRYKLKVSDAKRLGLDKDAGYVMEADAIRKDMSQSGIYGHDIGGSLLHVLTYSVNQDESTDYGMNFMRGVYSKLNEGIRVSEVCRGISDSRFSCEKVNDIGYLLDEIKSELFKIKGEGYSLPFISPEGIHIIVRSAPDAFGYSWNDCVSDILLASKWDKYYSDNIRKYSDSDLKDYFKANRKKYKWEFPHFKGAVVHCKSKKAAKAIKKRIKRMPLNKWEKTLEDIRKENSDYDAVIEAGLFIIGENQYIDKLVFKCGDYKALDGYPCTFTIGKCLDYMPDSYEDVYDALVQDYVLNFDNLYFESLERELRVEKYIDVLKTVNSDGSN